MTALAHALTQVARGRWVVALHGIENGACTCGREDCKSPGKHPYAPLCKNGLKDATNDPETVKRWFERQPWLNYGIVWGRRSGAFAIDLDVKPAEGIDGQESWYDLASGWGVLVDTETVLTGSGGLHYIFQYPTDIPEDRHISDRKSVV